jgi:signal transduction histidine kinase/ActR/RegA family two-component response regulator
LFKKGSESTCAKFIEPDQVQVWHALREPNSKAIIAVASINYKLTPLVDNAVSIAASHLRGCQIRLIDQASTLQYQHGKREPSTPSIRASMPLPAMHAQVEIIQDQQHALAAFYQAEFMLFFALGGVTLLLVVMTAIGTRLVTAELEQTTHELLIAKQIAEQANRSKTEFLANMSHEIRTPMTAILGFSELLQSESISPEETHRCLDTVVRNGKHLLAVINQILDLTKIEAGQFEVEQAECNLLELVDDIERLFRPQAEAKGINFTTLIAGELPDSIISDRTRLKQAMVNLVANALKFTKEGSVCLTICHCRVTETINLEISDTGIGLTQAQIKRIFQPFVQADSSTTRKYGGSGLGLAITRKIVHKLGGAVQVRSELDKGSRFKLVIPTGKRASSSNVSEFASPAEPVAMLTTSSTPALSTPDLGHAKILVVEDGPDNQRLITHYLGRLNIKPTLADNGQQGVSEALEAWQAGEPFDLIFMDLQMPVLDGYGATAHLRSVDYQGQIVALTAHALSTDRQRCLDQGFDGYLSKPVSRQQLLDEILHRVEPRQPEACTVPV